MRGPPRPFALALSSALFLPGCNAVFGIVQRTAGPTWCEATAQAGSAYCDDFDRVPAATLAQEDPQTQGGTLTVTSVVASSAPNSLEVTSPAVTGDQPRLVASNLVSFGSYSDTAGEFRCQMDVQPSEVSAFGVQGGAPPVAVLGLGGQVTEGQLTEFVFVSFGKGGTIFAQLGTVGAQDSVTMLGDPLPVLSTNGTDETWATLKISMKPVASDGGAGAGFGEGGVPPTLAGGKGKSGYVVVVQFGPFETAVLARVDLAGQPLAGYGLVTGGASPAITLHIDNVACSAAASTP